MPRSQRGCQGFNSLPVHHLENIIDKLGNGINMKVFNSKEAAEQYMSSHTLTFSTPDLTLKRFAFWLGDIVPDPDNKEETMPRLMNYIEEKDFAPAQVIDDDKYEPSGALFKTGLYGSANTDSNVETKFCSECGQKISASAKFCTECGADQD